MVEVIQVVSDDWTNVFIDGVLVFEGHNMDSYDLAQILADAISKEKRSIGVKTVIYDRCCLEDAFDVDGVHYEVENVMNDGDPVSLSQYTPSDYLVEINL